MADNQVHARRHLRPHSGLVTLAIVGVYAAIMISTNTRFTILDDEANSIAIAGRPFGAALWPFFAVEGYRELHPPAAEILWHFWMVATHYSFFALRIIANIFFIAAVLVTAKSAEKIGARPAYWAALLLGFVWPFAFQYGRIAGYYSVSMFLLAWMTWAYLGILEDEGNRPWVNFAAASVLLVWTNYFGFAFLFLLLADFLIFHRNLAVTRVRPLLAVIAVIAAAFLPLLRVAIFDVVSNVSPAASRANWINEIAVAGYPGFGIFGSAAIAPWFLPFSIPVFLAILALFAAIWFSRGRRWLVYFILSVVLLDLAGNLTIKRVIFMLPWLFLAMGLAASGGSSRYPRLALSAVAVIVLFGWMGIASGEHYVTSNLYEPWGKVAKVVAADARDGATIVSANAQFFFYLNYELGLESATQKADGAFLDSGVYRTHGYSILQPNDWETWADKLHGKVVMVNGSGMEEQVEGQSGLNDVLRRRCQALGEYRAAPDPAAGWKARFTKGVPVLAFRTEVVWYECPR